MKNLLFLFFLGLPLLGVANVPRPPCTYYGLVKDAYGQPFLSGARIVFMRGDTEVAHQDIDGLIDYGANFHIRVELDNGVGERYVPYAVREGEVLRVVVKVDGEAQPILEPAQLTVPAAGTDVRLALTVGEDTDGDGLPDAWEQELMAQSGGALTNLVQVLPGDDFDGDGSSNLHEYRAGTFAFLDDDCFALDRLQQAEDGRFLFRFLSVPGKSYGLELTDNLRGTNGWASGTFALDAGQPSTMTSMVGDGDFKTMYIEVSGRVMFMRLAAE